MQHRELETHHWNLPLGVAAASLLGGCGPLVIIDDTGLYETTELPTTTGPHDPTNGPQCNDTRDCPPGESCYDGYCWSGPDTCGYYYCDTDYYDTDYLDTFGDTDTDGIPPECQAHAESVGRQVKALYQGTDKQEFRA